MDYFAHHRKARYAEIMRVNRKNDGIFFEKII